MLAMLILHIALCAVSSANWASPDVTVLLTLFDSTNSGYLNQCVNNTWPWSQPWYLPSVDELDDFYQQYPGYYPVTQYTFDHCDSLNNGCNAHASGKGFDRTLNMTELPRSFKLSFTDDCSLNFTIVDAGVERKFSPLPFLDKTGHIKCYTGPMYPRNSNDGILDYLTLTFVDLTGFILSGTCDSNPSTPALNNQPLTIGSTSTSNNQSMTISSTGVDNFCKKYDHPIDSMSNGSGFSCTGNEGQDSQVYTWFLGLFAFVVFGCFCWIDNREKYNFVRALCSLCFSRSNETSTQGVVTYKPVQQ